MQSRYIFASGFFLLRCSSYCALPQVQMDEAVEQRMKAQSAKKHMEDKHAKEKRDVEVAQEAVDILETEFEVSHIRERKFYDTGC